MKQRTPSVAGSFYPADREELRVMLKDMTEARAGKFPQSGHIAACGIYLFGKRSGHYFQPGGDSGGM